MPDEAVPGPPDDASGPQPDVEVQDGRVEVSAPFGLIDGHLTPATEEERKPALLHGSVTPPRMAIRAARYFLDQVKRTQLNEAAVCYNLYGCVSAIRSSTFILQKHGSSHDGFEGWYTQKQEEMAENPRLRFLVELRNEAQKEGLELSGFGVPVEVFHFQDGSVEAYFGSVEIAVDGFEVQDLIGAVEGGIEFLEDLIDEAHELGFIEPVERQYDNRLEFKRERPDGAWEYFDPG